MVYTLSDIKHLETIASLENKAPEQLKSVIAEQTEDTSLTSTLLKLCNKLRANGFNRYADSIENKFVVYKTAGVHLYQAHKETGEDLIDIAHPDGDNKIVSDVSDNNGDVETITSRHKKIVDIVQKQPTGKLASYIHQCKIVLGQAASFTDDLYGQALELLNSYAKYFTFIAKKVSNPKMEESGQQLVAKMQNLLKTKSLYEASKAENVSTKLEDELTTEALYYKGQEEPGFFSSFEIGAVDPTTWKNEILPLFEKVEGFAKSFHDIVVQIVNQEGKDKTTSTLQDPDLTGKSKQPANDQVSLGFENALSQIEQMEVQVNQSNSEDKPAQLQWLAGMKKFIGDKMAAYSFSEDKASAYKQYADMLKQIKERLNGFKSEIG